jgi:hypothetical protein
MTHAALTPAMLWLVVLLGIYHGVNPGMGWLFAVALGMQEQNGRAVAKAIVPIAVGHTAAIGLVVLTASLLGLALPLTVIRYFVAALLAGLGIYSLVGHRHPRWIRMQVGFRDLTAWSFLMASAHGAGLMLVPVLLGSSTVQAADHIAVHQMVVTPLVGLAATAIHTTAYLAAAGILACLVYCRFGLALLRKAWFNFNLIWGVALVATGLFTLLI